MPWSKKEQEARNKTKPTRYSKEVVDRICFEIGNGKSLRTVLKEDDMPTGSVFFSWLGEHEYLQKQYARACSERSEAMAEDMQEIANNVDLKNGLSVQKARLQIDTMKWLMSKQKPKKYGDKLDVTSDGKRIPAPIYGGRSGESTKD